MGPVGYVVRGLIVEFVNNGDGINGTWVSVWKEEKTDDI